jgi:magnesium chelatase subunit D
VRAYEPGLLAAAHRGVLYVDEVNLLHDHLVDLLLDAAALGTSYVEREGVSVRHAARFLLVGTMNPEEGELRPQLLDRFGLTVEVAATRDPAERAEVVRRRMAYEADPPAFAARWADDDAELAAQIAAARERLPRVVLGDHALREVTTVCAAFDVDGLRADLVTAKAAVALAAWAGRDEVTTDDVRTAARLALPHRRRRTPFEAPGLDEQQLDDALSSVEPDAGEPEGPDDPGPEGGGPDGGGSAPPPAPDAASEEGEAGASGPSDASGEQEEKPAPAAASGERTRLPATRSARSPCRCPA